MWISSPLQRVPADQQRRARQSTGCRSAGSFSLFHPALFRCFRSWPASKRQTFWPPRSGDGLRRSKMVSSLANNRKSESRSTRETHRSFIWKNRTEPFSVFQLRSSKGVSLRLADRRSRSLKSKVTIYSADWTVWLAWFTPNKKQQSSKDCKLLLLTTDGSNWSLWTATYCQQVILSVAQ